MIWLIMGVLFALTLAVLGSQQGGKLPRVDYAAIKRLYGAKALDYSSGVVTDSLLLAVIAHESHGKPRAKGKAGEYGIFQIMPMHFEAAKIKEGDRFDIDKQFRIASDLLLGWARSLSAKGDFSLKNLYAAYNGGLGNYKARICQERAAQVLKHLEAFRQI
jgi:soluble lytic murein transglycosylase-like protein